MLGRPRPPKSPVFVEGFAPHTWRPGPVSFQIKSPQPSQLVLRYYWAHESGSCDTNQTFFCSSKAAKFSGKMRNALKRISNSRIFFVRLLVFEMWLILYMVDLYVFDHQNRSYTKSSISQILKVAQKNSGIIKFVSEQCSSFL